MSVRAYLRSLVERWTAAPPPNPKAKLRVEPVQRQKRVPKPKAPKPPRERKPAKPKSDRGRAHVDRLPGILAALQAGKAYPQIAAESGVCLEVVYRYLRRAALAGNAEVIAAMEIASRCPKCGEPKYPGRERCGECLKLERRKADRAAARAAKLNGISPSLIVIDDPLNLPAE